MRTVWIVAFNQVQRLAADRAGLALLLLLPLTLNLILGVSLQNTFTTTLSLDRPARAAVSAGEGPMAAALAEALASPDVKEWVEVEPAAGPDEALAALHDRRVDAAVIIPTGLPGEPVRIVAEPGNVRSTVVNEVVRAGLGALADPAVARIPVEMVRVDPGDDAGAGARLPGSMDYYAVGLSVMMLFYAAARGTESLLDDRKNGVYLRVRSGGVGRVPFLLGKLVGSVVLGLLLMMVLAVSTRLIYGVHWGDPAGWLLLSVSAALAASGINLLLVALVRRAEVLDPVSGAVFQVMGFFGGSMMPIYIFPEIMQRVSNLLPNRWMLDGYLTLVLDGTAADVVGHATMLLAAAAATIAAGWLVEAVAARAGGEA